MGISSYEPEQQLVIDTFQNKLSKYKDKNIVIYGIGKNTEAVLFGTSGFNFIGLMDQNTVGQTIYGKRVLSYDEVIKLGSETIIVIIARQSVVNIIYQRIRNLYVKYLIPIYDYSGTLLGKNEAKYTNESLEYWNYCLKDLYNAIDSHQVITYDIFDTLIMRDVLEPTDIFDIVEKKLEEKGLSYPFKEIRIQSEQQIKNYPDLNEIYSTMGEKHEIPKEHLKLMCELECHTDLTHMLRRDVICQSLNYAKNNGKKIYLISDMYYSKDQLISILSHFGIWGYEDIFVSCDCKAQKADTTLFRLFLDMTQENDILHIGDNRRSDIDMAKKIGIDTFHIYSAYELLMASSLQGILTNVNSLFRRVLIGTLVCKCFNNPFVLSNSRGWVHIENTKVMGYYFIAPMMEEFTKWLEKVAHKHGIEQILFPSRDGYLIQKIYRLLYGNIDNLYFRTSRRAATVSALVDDVDIKNIAERKYTGTVGQFLKDRFGIVCDAEDERTTLLLDNISKKELIVLLSDYSQRILINAESERKAYIRYLANKGVSNNKKIMLFDFVASGTIQHNISKILCQPLLGAYFASMNLPNRMYDLESKEIITAYGNITSYSAHNNLAKHYLLLETILVDDSYTFSHIDSEGKEIFSENESECRTKDIEVLQNSILEFCSDWKQRWGDMFDETLDLAFVDEIYGLLFLDNCKINNGVKSKFVNDDIYDGISSYQLW